MSVGGGTALIVGASALALLAVFRFWRLLPAAAAFGALGVCGALIAVGGLLVQDGPGAWDFVGAIAALGVLMPVHARLVFGPPGAMR